MQKGKIMKPIKYFAYIILLFNTLTNALGYCIEDQFSSKHKSLCNSFCCGYPFFSYRSQTTNLAREMVGWHRDINLCNPGDILYGSFSIVPEYTKTFRPSDIAHYLFCSNCLLIQGNDIENRSENALMAENFGLPHDYQSIVKFSPRIQNFVIDLNFFLGLNELHEGIYFKIHAPLVHTHWDLCAREDHIKKGSHDFLQGEIAQEKIERNDLPSCFLDFMAGGKTFGDIKEGLKFGKISSYKQKKTRLSDIHLTFGYNFFCSKNYHFGAGIYAIAPTGNRPEGALLFEPIIGNGKHWGLGASFSTSGIMWRSNKEENYFGIYMDANITHLFKATQKRSFDFCHRPFSRYLLIEEMGENDGIKGQNPTFTPANYQYQGNLINAINVSTLAVNVKINIQADLAIKLAYTTMNSSLDLGYNLWTRSKEKIFTDCACGSKKSFAIKGNSLLYGQYEEDEEEDIVRLSQTNNLATICKGNAEPNQIDLAQLAHYGDDNLPVQTIYEPHSPVYTSIQPIILGINDLNLCGTPSAITHKIFAHFSYAWDKKRNKDWRPYLGFGGEVEFDGKRNKVKNSASQWGIWLKGGISFD